MTTQTRPTMRKGHHQPHGRKAGLKVPQTSPALFTHRSSSGFVLFDLVHSRWFFIAVVAALLVVIAFAAFGQKSPAASGTHAKATTQQDQQTIEPTASAKEATVPTEILQMPDHPAGCEIVSLQSALSAFGLDYSFDELYDLFSKSDNDFVTSWWGDPDSEGAVYPPAVEDVGERVLSGTPYDIDNVTGCSFDFLLTAVESGENCLLWITTDDQYPDWSGITVGDWEMYTNEHCVVMYGFDDDEVLLMDPLQGYRSVDLDALQDLWESCGSMAVVIG